MVPTAPPPLFAQLHAHTSTHTGLAPQTRRALFGIAHSPALLSQTAYALVVY